MVAEVAALAFPQSFRKEATHDLDYLPCGAGAKTKMANAVTVCLFAREDGLSVCLFSALSLDLRLLLRLSHAASPCIAGRAEDDMKALDSVPSSKITTRGSPCFSRSASSQCVLESRTRRAPSRTDKHTVAACAICFFNCRSTFKMLMTVRGLPWKALSKRRWGRLGDSVALFLLRAALAALLGGAAWLCATARYLPIKNVSDRKTEKRKERTATNHGACEVYETCRISAGTGWSG